MTSPNTLASLLEIDRQLRSEIAFAYALVDVSALQDGNRHAALKTLGAGTTCGNSLSSSTQPMLYGPLDLESKVASNLIDLDREEASVHFLWSASLPHPLAEHLHDLTRGTDEDGNDLFVRYFDRTIWPYYWSALTERQQGLALGPIAVWATAESDAELTAVRAPSGHPAQSASRRRYTREQIRRMTLATLPQALWATMDDEFPEHVGNEKGVLATLRELVDRADALGLTQSSDFYRFAHMGLGMHTHFDVHPAVAQELKQIAYSAQTLDQALVAVDIAVWEELKNADQRAVIA